ncbi:MAG: HPr family phosphocarrier protein [Eubacteriales bacterium]|nr:HPr family phosphocarrier protein [Eubacteriales bacterium]
MQTITYTITDPEGFHARPAGMFVKEAKKFPCTIHVIKGGQRADARKMFGLMGLGIKGGQQITIECEGEQEAEAAAALEAFLKENL